MLDVKSMSTLSLLRNSPTRLLALSIAALGAAQATSWIWAPKIALWQTAMTLERYQSIEYLDSAMQIYQESMRQTFIEAAVVGALMLISSILLIMRNRAGWSLWLACLCLALAGAALTLVSSGLSAGLFVRIGLLCAFSLATFKAYRSPLMARWFK